MSKESINNHAALIWAVANILRGPFKPFQYGRVVLPFAILRRLDCVLEATKEAVVETANSLPSETDDEARFMILAEIAQAGDDGFADEAGAADDDEFARRGGGGD